MLGDLDDVVGPGHELNAAVGIDKAGVGRLVKSRNRRSDTKRQFDRQREDFPERIFRRLRSRGVDAILQAIARIARSSAHDAG
jgi:hypothetical protein